MPNEEQVIGLWKLISQHTLTADGRVIPTRGEDPAGVVIYDKFGNMSVNLMRTDERASEYTDLTKYATVIEGYHGYFGTYEVDPVEPIIRHYVMGAAYRGYIGTVQVRYYELRGDDLVLTVKEEDGSQHVLIWQRVTSKLSADSSSPVKGKRP